MILLLNLYKFYVKIKNNILKLFNFIFYTMQYSQYYQAHVKTKECCFFVAILRSCEHLTFDRTFDTKASIFEFLVPEKNEAAFLNLMNYFIKNNIVTDLKKLPNRLINPDAEV